MFSESHTQTTFKQKADELFPVKETWLGINFSDEPFSV